VTDLFIQRGKLWVLSDEQREAVMTSEPVFVGSLPRRQDVDVLPSEDPGFMEIPTDSEGYFLTGVRDDDPMLGKDEKHFESLLGIRAQSLADLGALVDLALEMGARDVRVVPYSRPEYLNAHMGRLHIYLDANDVVDHLSFESIYTRWRMSTKITCIRNAKAISKLTI
jgi:hypothetical protein